MTNTKNWFQLRPMYSYIRKQAENKKFLKYLEIGGTFTLIAMFLFFAIMPTMTTISSLIGDIKSKEAFIKKADLKITKIIQAQTNYSQVQAQYYLIEDSFPSLAQYYQGTSNLATVFRDSLLDINQISLNLKEDKDNKNQFFETYQVNISGEGQYSFVMEMVKKILSNRRLINAAEIRLDQSTSTDDNQIGSKKIKVNLSSDLYFLPTNNE